MTVWPSLLGAAARKRQITRQPSPVMAYLTPWLSIALASMGGIWPTIAQMPLLPPLGFLFLLGWRQLHPGLLPVWSGFVLGLVDDLFSGQPFGSAMFSWSIAMLLLDIIEFRFPWRNFVIEWVVAAGMIVAYILLTGLIANAGGGQTALLLLAPQMIVAVLLYPVVGRVVAWLDRLRLTRFQVF